MPLRSCTAFGTGRVGQPLDQRPLVDVGERLGVDVGRVVGRAALDREPDALDHAGAAAPAAAQAHPDPAAGAGVLLQPARHLVRAEHGRRSRRSRSRPPARLAVSVWNSRSRSTRNCRLSKSLCTSSRSHWPSTQVLRADRHRHVPDQLGQLPVAQHAGQVRPQRVAGLALDLVDPLDQRGQRAELADPLGRGLLADARHARQVVAGVAAQRGEVRILRGGQPVPRLDLRPG